MGERHTLNVRELFPDASVRVLTKRTAWEKADSEVLLVSSEEVFFSVPCDVYIIANETNKHADTVLKCLAHAPKGIFLEKPLSHSLENLEKIKELVTAQKTVFVVGYSLQYFEPLLELKRIVQSGTLGKIISMRVSVGKDMRGWRELEYQTRYSSHADQGGGAILDYVHELNYPGWLLDETITFVTGVWGTVFLPIDAEDFSETIFVSEKGTIVSIHQDYVQVPGKRYCEVVGEKGTATFSRILRRGSLENQVQIDTEANTEVRMVEAGGNDMFLNEMKSFMEHVAKGDGYTNIVEAIADTQNVMEIKQRAVKIGN